MVIKILTDRVPNKVIESLEELFKVTDRYDVRLILLVHDPIIALGVIYNFSHPLPGQFHYCFTPRGVLWDIHNG